MTPGHRLLTLLALAPLWQANVAESATTLAQCRAIENDQERLACYDALAGAESESTEHLPESEPQVATSDQQSATADGVQNVAQSDEELESLEPIVPQQEVRLLTKRRLREERRLANRAFVITPHHRNYLLPVTYNSRLNDELWNESYPDDDMKHFEAKFQLSIKALVWQNIFSNKLTLWGAYTQENWWQLYAESSPFRETNYQPELYFALENDWEFLGFTNSLLTLGYNHQSNGRGSDLSRSWNRILGSAVLERDRMTLVARLWYRLPENEKDDDNRDIVAYEGYGDLTGIWEYEGHEFSVLLKNNLRSDNKGAVQLEWTFPLTPRFKGYVQYYYGYGESLIDYDYISNRIGIGVSINDIL